MSKQGKRFFAYLDHKKSDNKIFYIGKANEHRIKAISRNKKHDNIVKKYGMFRETIECESEILALQLEEFLIKEHHTYVDDPLCDEHACNFKTSSDYVRGEYSQESCDNMRKSQSIQINQYSLTGKFISTYESAKCASKFVNVSSSAINACCRGVTKSAGKFIWKRVDKNFPIGVSFNVIQKDERVNKYDKNGKYIETINSIKLTKELGISFVRQCCDGKLKSSGGFMWRWFKDHQSCCDILPTNLLPKLINPVRDNVKHPKRKSVSQFDLDNVFIKTYESISYASKITKVNHSSISQCCLGRYPYAGGFIWKFV